MVNLLVVGFCLSPTNNNAHSNLTITGNVSRTMRTNWVYLNPQITLNLYQHHHPGEPTSGPVLGIDGMMELKSLQATLSLYHKPIRPFRRFWRLFDCGHL